MKFEFMKEVDDEVFYYGYMVKTGDVVDFTENHLAAKCMKNPDWKQTDKSATVKEKYKDPDVSDLQAIIVEKDKEIASLKANLAALDNAGPVKRKVVVKKKKSTGN